MIRERYRVEGVAKTRYVRKHLCQDWYEWCEQSAADPRYDVAQGTAEPEDVPEDLRIICENNKTLHYACEWSL